MSKSWDKDWFEREAQRRLKTDRIMDMARGDIKASEVDQALEVAKRRKARQEEQDAPVFSECVIGYRQWQVDALDQLWPITVAKRPWAPGVNEAVCDAHHYANSFWMSTQLFYGQQAEPKHAPAQHKAPHKNCECGLYAWRRIKPQWRIGEGELLPPYMPHIVGAVAFWGDVRVHREGFRAEKACIVALAYRGDRPEVAAVVERVAARYGAEAVPLGELEVAASRYGTPLPDTLQPPQPAIYADLSGLYTQVYNQLWYGSGAASGSWGISQINPGP
jgi:hypothetical protein